MPAKQQQTIRAVVLALCALAALSTLLSSMPTQAQSNPPGSATITDSFLMSARHWNVPVEILMAIGYAESHWEQRDGQPSIDDGYGIMHLVDAPNGTLQRS